METGTMLGNIKCETTVRNMNIFSNNNSTLVAAALGDSNIKIWDLRNLKEIKTLSGHTDYCNIVQVYNYNIVSGADDNTVKFWDWRMDGNQALIKSYRPTTAEEGVYSLMRDETTLVCGFGNGKFEIWKDLP
eukprot:TRINITY_DN14565_c0_g1_i1.p1 TRINITY_DN14565_c0_g1~~TRINITY_DN14565_c0_g1_i1.p1  ORF type:complete len:132 (-),score=25.16 TRINITY_DN14565_c0_g1_i1:21-416(-)